MTEPRRLRKRKSADEKFKELIDNFFIVDDIYKLFNDERNKLIDQIRKKLRYGHRGLGVHLGKFFAINAHRVQRRQFSQKKARELMGLKLYDQAYVLQKYVQVDAMEQDDAQKLSPEPLDQKET